MKTLRILAIESSCDETAAAVIEDGRKMLSNVVDTQIATHALYGGVVPEIASRRHMEAVVRVTEQALADAEMDKHEVDAVAATCAPGLIGALLVGANFGKSLAFAMNKPFIPVHHIRGHIAATYLAYPELKPPFLTLIASGGHSEIVMVKDYTEFEILGGTRDDAAGEAFDKVARVLGVGYPGGPKIDKISKEGNPEAITFPRAKVGDSEYDFSFSGLKSSVLNYLNSCQMKGEEINRADVAASFPKAVTQSPLPFPPLFLLPLSQLQIGHRIEIQTAAHAGHIFVITGHTDHGRIVGTEDRGRTVKADALFFACCFHGRAECPVGCNAAGDRQTVHMVIFGRTDGIIHQNVHNGLLEGRSDVCFDNWFACHPTFVQMV